MLSLFLFYFGEFDHAIDEDLVKRDYLYFIVTTTYFHRAYVDDSFDGLSPESRG